MADSARLFKKINTLARKKINDKIRKEQEELNKQTTQQKLS